MKKLIVFVLVFCLLAVPVSAENFLIHDDSGLLKEHDIEKLEQVYSEFSSSHGFTPALVTVDSFGGLSAEDFAGEFYDIQGYPEDGILYLVSLQEGQWYILTNGECHSRISDSEAAAIGEELVNLLRDGQYYAAFLQFPEKAGEVFLANEPVETMPSVDDQPQEEKASFGKTFMICMLVGLLIGGIAVAVMAVQMKSVRAQHAASDYLIPGSARLTNSRDIYLYSRVTRSPKPKSNGSSGGRGGSRGGAGGRI